MVRSPRVLGSYSVMYSLGSSGIFSEFLEGRFLTRASQSLKDSRRHTVSTEVNFCSKRYTMKLNMLWWKLLLGLGIISIADFLTITFWILSSSLVQLSMTSYENSRLLWHILSELITHWAISRQNLSIKGSCSLMIEKILLKQSTAESRLNGSGWFELLSILLISDLMLFGFSLISLSVIYLRLHFANSATALLHISLSAELLRLAAPSIKASSKDSTSGCSYTLLLENHRTIWKIKGSKRVLEIYSVSLASLMITGKSF